MKVVVRTSAYDKWIKNLRDARAIALIYARIGRLAEGNPGDAAPIGAGCSELRIHHAPVIEKTIGHIARSKGMAQIARELHIDRLDSIHRLPKAAAHLSLR